MLQGSRIDLLQVRPEIIIRKHNVDRAVIAYGYVELRQLGREGAEIGLAQCQRGYSQV